MNRMTAKSMTRRAGFTLVELMVAMSIGVFLVVTVFYVMTNSSRAFALQSDVSQVADRMNYAMDTVKNDLRRASFLTMPNAYLDTGRYPWYRSPCATPPWMAAPDGNRPVAHAVWVDNDGSGGPVERYLPDLEERVVYETPDRLLLLGAYRTSRTFKPTQMQAGINTIRVANEDLTDNEMSYIFNGAIVMVATPAGGYQYLSVEDVRPLLGIGETELTFDQALVADPRGTGLEACNFQGFGGLNFEVTPLHFVRYTVGFDPDDRASSLLVREELTGDLSPIVPAARYVVARDIVDFQVWFDGVQEGTASASVINDGAAAGGNLVDDEGTIANNRLDGTAAALPHNVRHAYIQLSSRLDTNVTRTAPARGEILEFIELQECVEGEECVPTNEFTPVHTIRGETTLPNVMLANVRSL